MLCKKCGNELSEGYKFCTNCGSPIVFDDEAVLSDQETVSEIVSEAVECEVPLDVDKNTDNIDNTDTSDNTDASDNSDNSEIVEDEPFCDKNVDSEQSVNDDEKQEPIENSDATEDVSYNNENTQKPQADVSVKKKRKVGRVISVIVSVLLCIVLFSMLFCATAVQVFRVNIHPNAINDAFALVDFKNIKITELLPEDILADMGLNTASDDLVDFIYNNIDQDQLDKPLTKEKISEIIENNSLIDKIFSIISNNLIELAEGKFTSVITADEFCDVIYEEKDFIRDVVGYTITEKHINNLRSYLEYNYGELFNEVKIDESIYEFDEQNAVVIIKDIASWLFYVLIVVIVLIVALVFLLLRSFSRGFKYSGITAIVCGILEVGAACAGLSVFNMIIADNIVIELEILKNIILAFINNTLMSLLWIGITILIIGIVFVVTSIIINILKKRKAHKLA